MRHRGAKIRWTSAAPPPPLDAEEAHRARAVSFTAIDRALLEEIVAWGYLTYGEIGLLVDFHDAPSLFELAHLDRELTAVLGFPVDVICSQGLRTQHKSKVLAAAVPLSPRISRGSSVD